VSYRDPTAVEYDFDVAISFAAPEREVARELARLMSVNGVAVFFDEFYSAELWGKDLVESLAEIYERRARYCVVLISKSYCERPYTILERRTAMLRALESKEPYLLPIVTDDAWPKGLPRSTAFVDLRNTPPRTVATLLVRKVRGDGFPVALPEDGAPKIVSFRAIEETAPDPRRAARDHVSFELLRLLPGSRPWIESSGRNAYRSGLNLGETPMETHQLAHRREAWWHVFSGGMFGDPILDVTICNRSAEMVLLSSLGIRFTSVAHFWPGRFGSSTHVVPEEVPLAATFSLELPDLVTKLEDEVKAGRVPKPRSAMGGVTGTLTVDELSAVQLPNPVHLERGLLYRFALSLLEYQALMPSEAVAHLWAKTGSGEWTSEPFLIEYNVGISHGGKSRLGSLRRRWVELTAAKLWREAGRPQGRDEEFWLAAERELIARRARKLEAVRADAPPAPDAFVSPHSDWDRARWEHVAEMTDARTRPP